jgi:hypothetical protein
MLLRVHTDVNDPSIGRRMWRFMTDTPGAGGGRECTLARCNPQAVANHRDDFMLHQLFYFDKYFMYQSMCIEVMSDD